MIPRIPRTDGRDLGTTGEPSAVGPAIRGREAHISPALRITVLAVIAFISIGFAAFTSFVSPPAHGDALLAFATSQPTTQPGETGPAALMRAAEGGFEQMAANEGTGDDDDDSGGGGGGGGSLPPTITISSKPASSTIWDSDTTEIAAGAVDSDAHTADISIVTSNPFTTVLVTLDGGDGHVWGKDACLMIGWDTLLPGDQIELTTDANGELYGALVSSDVLDGATVEVADEDGNDASLYVAFGWNNYTESDAWQSQYDLPTPTTSTEVLTYKHNGDVMDGHSVGFYVEEVRTVDQYGNSATYYNTIDNPSDLSSFATITSSATTDQYGQATVQLTVNDTTPVVIEYIVIRAYDLTVWNNE